MHKLLMCMQQLKQGLAGQCGLLALPIDGGMSKKGMGDRNLVRLVLFTLRCANAPFLFFVYLACKSKA
jgi:hypothetical protein